MPAFGPISRRELLLALRSAGFEGPYSGGRHQFMVRDQVTVFIPNPPHVSFLGRAAGPIPIIEEIKHLEDLTHDRIFFFGVPIRVHNIEASWIRAFAFEPRD